MEKGEIMQLKEWLEKEDMTMRAFAFYTGVSELSVHNWISGKFKPMGFYQKLISKFTKGEVTQEDWKHGKTTISKRSGNTDELHTTQYLGSNETQSAKKHKAKGKAGDNKKMD